MKNNFFLQLTICSLLLCFSAISYSQDKKSDPPKNYSFKKGMVNFASSVTDRPYGTNSVMALPTDPWILGGNYLSTGNEYIGTNSNNDLIFKRGGIYSGRISTSNTVFGYQAMLLGNLSGANSAFGSNALSALNGGTHNVAVGDNALMSNTIGSSNTSVGSATLQNNLGGQANTAIGEAAGLFNINGDLNLALGWNSLFFNTAGSYNTAVGSLSLLNSLGNYNSAVGINAGSDLISGDNNIFIGANTTSNISTSASNQLNIGNAIYGYKSDGVNANIGIGVPDPAARLHTNGTLKFEGLGTNTTNTNILTTDGAGNVTTRALSTIISSGGGPDSNIYDNNGFLTSDRHLFLNNESLIFSNNSSSLDSKKISIIPIGGDPGSDMSILSIRDLSLANPNLDNIGYFSMNSYVGRMFTYFTQGISNSAHWMQSASMLDSVKSTNPFLINPLGGNIGIGLGATALPTAQLHTNGSLRFQGLGANTTNTNFLTTDSFGNVTTRDLASFISSSTSVNIYNSDGTLGKDRTVKFDKYSLKFLDDAHNNNQLVMHPIRFSDHKDSFLSVKLVREDFFQQPNLFGWGMSNISHPKSGISLTQGLWEWDKERDLIGGNWLQSSIVRNSGRTKSLRAPSVPIAVERSEPFPLLLNPIGGNVGVGVEHPTAQLHTIKTVRFEDLADGDPKIPFSLLGTDPYGNVYEYDPNLFGGVVTSDPMQNIYTVDGSLKDEREVYMGHYNLHFMDKYKSQGVFLPDDFNDDKDNSFLSVELNREGFFQEPNLRKWGMFNISNPRPNGITLTQGLWNKATWLQSSIGSSEEALTIFYNSHGEPLPANDEYGNPTVSVDGDGHVIPVRDSGGKIIPVYDANGNPYYNLDGEPLMNASAGRGSNFPLLINPLKGNVGIGVIDPSAQLHVIDSVRFENLANPEKAPDFILGTDSNGNVYEYNPSIFGSSSSDTDDWKIGGNANTNPAFNFIGTTNPVDLVVRSGNTERFRFTSSASGRVIVNNLPGLNWDQNFYLGGGNNVLNPTMISPWGPIAANTAVGYGTLINNFSGNTNTALGSNVLGNNLAGSSNVGVGVNALMSNRAGMQNVAIGVNAMSNAGTSPSQLNTANTALGNQSLQAFTTGQSNVGIGSWSGFNLTGGSNNVLIGSVESPSFINSGATTANSELNIGGWITGKSGSIGIGVSPALPDPNTILNTRGNLRFQNLPANTNTNVLTIDVNGNVATRTLNNWTTATTTNLLTLVGNDLTSNVNGVSSMVNLSSLITAPVINNIYTNNGTLQANRIVSTEDKTLRFNFGSAASPTLNEVVINPSLTASANLSVATARADNPNLNGLGMSRLDSTQSSFLTSGYSTFSNRNYFWTQASNLLGSVPTASNYMINPLGGKVAIGTSNINACADCGEYRLFVAQGIRTEKVRVDLASVKGWADFVFEKKYELMPLKELEVYINQNKHLPNIPKAEELVKTGIDLGEMNAKLLEKIEELTLHTIEINKQNETLQKGAAEQKETIQSLIERLEKLENKTKQ